MGRLRLAVIAIALVAGTAQGVELTEGHEVTLGIEAGYLAMSGYPSWIEGSAGKLRHDSEGLVLSRAYADYRGRIADTLHARMALELYDDNVGEVIDYTQAYLDWRPVPRSPTRLRLKAGVFYPRISLENTGAGWSSPYTLNSSAINTWVAEELRSTGLELSVSRRPEALGGAHTLSLVASAFFGSDPAGSLLAWKGWSVHDRQTRPSDELPLPPVPQLQPGGMFSAQETHAEPLLEIDDELGYYVSGEWRMAKKFLVRIMHYDNRADPTLLEKGQYGWTTKFDHIGVQVALPLGIDLLAQWMDGSTVMGPDLGEWHAVDNEYKAEYLLLTREFDQHRLTARYDHFQVTDEDEMPEDDNSENGHAWTLNYQYVFNDKATLALEWLSIKTHRGAWAYYHLETTATERQFQATVRLRF